MSIRRLGIRSVNLDMAGVKVDEDYKRYTLTENWHPRFLVLQETDNQGIARA